MTTPLFTDEGPEYYDAAYRHNVPFSRPGPYVTSLDGNQEKAFRDWVASKQVPYDPNEQVSDYDMRGFWRDTGGSNWRKGQHFPDTYKTPYDTTFSRESRWATPDCPFVWQGDNLIDMRNGQLIFGTGAKSKANWVNGYQSGGEVKLNPMQELTFLSWAQSEGVQPTDAMRRMWASPKKGYDTGGVVGDEPGDPRFTYPYPYDPEHGAAPRDRKMPWSTEPGGGLDFLGENTKEKGVQNIIAAAEAALKVPWVKASGETWYRAAYDWVAYMKETTGSEMEMDRLIAICAELSRNTDWWTNMMRFRRYMSGGLKVSGDPYAVGQDVYNVVRRIEDPQLTPDPMMAISGQKPHNFGWSIKRAGTDFTQPALIKPDEFGDPVAMDRWAKRIAMGVSDQPDVMGTDKKSLYDLVDALQGKGEYPSPTGVGKWSKAFDLMADMYREAAGRLGMSAADMLQSLVWVYEGPTKDMQSRTADPTIKRFMETGEWKFPLTDEEIADMIIESVRHNPDGFTFDVTGESPKRGMAYSPDKTTEFKLEPGQLSREDIVRYIREHPNIWLKGSGGNIGGWIDAEGRLTLDVSKIGDVSVATIRAAQKAEQDAVFDFQRGELVVGNTIRDADGNPIGYDKSPIKPKDLLEEHLKKPLWEPEPEPTPTPEPTPPLAPKPIEPEPTTKPPLPPGGKQMKERELPEGGGSPGPGSPGRMPKFPDLAPGLKGLGQALTSPEFAFGSQEDQLVIGKDGKEYHGDGREYKGPREETKEELKQAIQPGWFGPGGVLAGTIMNAPPAGNANLEAWQLWSAGQGPRPPGPVPEGLTPPTGPVSPLGPRKPGAPSTGGFTIPAKPGRKADNNNWAGIQLEEEVTVRHVNGMPPSTYKLRRTGPNQYESPDKIPVGPGDQLFINGRRVK